jgi:hypothetical protein
MIPTSRGPCDTLDATTFGLPPMPWDEFFWNWNTTLSMSDQIFTTARSAGSLVLDPGRGTAFQFSADGLTASLVRAMSYCITGWQLAGRAVPPDLMPILQAAASLGAGPCRGFDAGPGTDAGPPAAPVSLRVARLRADPVIPTARGYSFAPLLPLPATPPPQGDAHLTALCQGAWYSDPDHVQVADLDGDGREDFVLNWSGVQCQGAMTGRAFCGAANCRIDVFMSSRGYASPIELLGVAADVVLDDAGAHRPAVVGNGLRLCRRVLRQALLLERHDSVAIGPDHDHEESSPPMSAVCRARSRSSISSLPGSGRTPMTRPNSTPR